jgi:hypothetical protein
VLLCTGLTSTPLNSSHPQVILRDFPPKQLISDHSAVSLVGTIFILPLTFYVTASTSPVDYGATIRMKDPPGHA